MGQASEFLFVPPYTSRIGDVEMPKNEPQVTRDSVTAANIQREEPLTSSAKAQDIQSAARSASTCSSAYRTSLANGSGAKDVAGRGFPGSSVFRGLGQVLYNILMLDTLDAKEKFHDASTQTEEETEEAGTADESSGLVGSPDNLKLEMRSILRGMTLTSTSEEYRDSIQRTLSLRYAGDAGDIWSESRSNNNESHTDPGPSSLLEWQGLSASTIHPDDTITEEVTVEVRRPTNSDLPRLEQTQPELVLAHSPREEGQGYVSGRKPLFQDFSRPSVILPGADADEAESVNYDDLEHSYMSNQALLENTRSSSDDFSIYSAGLGSGDEAAIDRPKPNGFRRMKTARKVTTGQYHRKQSFAKVRLHRLLKSMTVDDPRIQAIATVRKPTVVPSFVRHISYQPIVFDGTESEDDTACAASDGDTDFLAPFNRL
ncbi:MAG: hypothetical protein LQ338_007300 [Usnochroma carphineum]|nr:MAG: hypothetical protein LQ338_007300 [Usnochroma carphineum]